MAVSSDKLDSVSKAIGKILTDVDLESLVAKATGEDIYNVFATRDDPRMVKIRKTLKALEDVGRERWLLTYVLIHAGAQDELCRAVVDAFPATLISLPQADGQVTSTLTYLCQLLNSPLPPSLRFELEPKQSPFAEIVKGIVVLFAYKNIHECLLKLLFTLNINEALLANPVEHLPPNLESIARQMDQIVEQTADPLALLGANAVQENVWVGELPRLSAALRATEGAPEKAADVIDQIQRLVRVNLAGLNRKIFDAVQNLSFDALTGDDLPSSIQDRNEFKEMVQVIRDLKVTVLARVLKHKMWLEAENQISQIRSDFDLPDYATGLARQWFKLRSRVDWLAKLDPSENWDKQAEGYATEIDDELGKEQKLGDDARMHFETYRSWFRDPFLKIDESLKMDCGSLRRIDDPLTKIVNEL
jgi:hypothetical protein